MCVAISETVEGDEWIGGGGGGVGEEWELYWRYQLTLVPLILKMQDSTLRKHLDNKH